MHFGNLDERPLVRGWEGGRAPALVTIGLHSRNGGGKPSFPTSRSPGRLLSLYLHGFPGSIIKLIMPGTERLYYNDSHLIEFDARVVDTSERVSGWTAVTLDQTAFYPTGGGQPSDTGTLNGTRVVECIDDEKNGVLHVIQGRAPEIGSTV